MKNAFIVYFNDNSGLVVISVSVASVVSSLEPSQIEKIVRIDSIPYPVL